MKTLVIAETRTFMAVILLALSCSSLIYVSAQRKGKPTPAKQAAVKPGAADQQARRRADALLAQMTLDEKLGQRNQRFMLFQTEESLNDGIRKSEIGSLL